jgi:hypothetical protein
LQIAASNRLAQLAVPEDSGETGEHGSGTAALAAELPQRAALMRPWRAEDARRCTHSRGELNYPGHGSARRDAGAGAGLQRLAGFGDDFASGRGFGTLH